MKKAILFILVPALAFPQGPSVNTGGGSTTTGSSAQGTDYIFTQVPPLARYIASAQVGGDGATVSTWTDSSGNGLSATLGGGTPTMNRQTINGIPAINFDGASWFELPIGVSLNKVSSSICIVLDSEGGTSANTSVFLNFGGSNADAYFLQTAGITNYGGFQVWHAGADTGIGLHSSGIETLCFTRSTGGSGQITYRDDASATTAALSAGTTTGGEIGADNNVGAFPAKVNIYEVAIFQSVLTPTNVADFNRYSRQTYKSRQYGPQFMQVIDIGDSITSGFNATLGLGRPAQSYPMRKQGQFTWVERNIGLAGQTMQTIAGASVAGITALFNASYQKNVLVIADGYNDLNVSLRTAAQLEADLATYVTALRAGAAWTTILVATVTPAPLGGDAGAETQRGLYNTYLKSTSRPGGTDGIVDITADSIMTTFPANTSYYNSQHPNNSGYLRLGRVFTDGIERTTFSGVPLTTYFPAVGSIQTQGNCTSSASPAVCAATAAGSVVIAAAATTVVVNTTAVTANSQISVWEDQSLGTLLGVTCNTQSSLVIGSPKITARTAGTSFTIGLDVAPTLNPACVAWTVHN